MCEGLYRHSTYPNSISLFFFHKLLVNCVTKVCIRNNSGSYKHSKLSDIELFESRLRKGGKRLRVREIEIHSL